MNNASHTPLLDAELESWLRQRIAWLVEQGDVSATLLLRLDRRLATGQGRGPDRLHELGALLGLPSAKVHQAVRCFNDGTPWLWTFIVQEVVQVWLAEACREYRARRRRRHYPRGAA
jgi:hypothetical protein